MLQENPPGMFVTVSILLAFHPEFLNKHDRIYNVQCFYMTMESVLTKEIQVELVFKRLGVFL